MCKTFFEHNYNKKYVLFSKNCAIELLNSEYMIQILQRLDRYIDSWYNKPGLVDNLITYYNQYPHQELPGEIVIIRRYSNYTYNSGIQLGTE